jgi:effector-binding domain-containing protein
MAMTRRMLSVVALVAVSLALYVSQSATGRADDAGEAKAPVAKSPAAAEAKDPEVGEVRIRTLAPRTYAYVATETTFAELGNAVGEAMGKVQKAAEDGTIKVDGPFVITYPKGSAHLTPDKPFQAHIGLIVQEGSKGGGDVKVRKTEPFKAATVLYTGSVFEVGRCYQKLFPAIDKMGLAPSGEAREFTLYFEELESPNNVVLVQVGVKDKNPPKAAAAEARQAGDATKSDKTD